jgi:glycosyltransferase involved in cell wall biosynthesis
MNKDKHFSVSMSVYKNDDSEHFKQAIESVYNQTLLPSEIVLVVDGPVNSEISKVIFDFKKKGSNFKVVWLEKNLGHAGARRIGLKNCAFDIVALMDSDDISVENRFEKQLDTLLKDKSISLVGGQIEEFDNDTGETVGHRVVPLDDVTIKKYMKIRCPMNQVTVMFRKKDVLKAGGYLDWHHNEDYYLWIRMAIAENKFNNIDDVLVKVRVNRDMYMRRGGWLYFNSERKIQQLMYSENIINSFRLISNVSIRFMVQVLMPNSIRKFLFTKLFRN